MPDHTGKRLEGTITMKDFRLNQMLMITALMLALAAMLAASPAGARPVDLDGTELKAADHSVATMPTWQRAIQLRSEALDRYYGLGQDNTTSTYEKAIQARSEALDRYYGLGDKAENETSNSGWYTGLEYSDLPQPVQSDDGFEWGGVQIGAGAALAALLLATLTTIGLRSRGGRPATS